MLADERNPFLSDFKSQCHGETKKGERCKNKIAFCDVYCGKHLSGFTSERNFQNYQVDHFRPGKSAFESLPSDVVRIIALFSDVRSILQLSMTCKSFANTLFVNQRLWTEILKRKDVPEALTITRRKMFTTRREKAFDSANPTQLHRALYCQEAERTVYRVLALAFRKDSQKYPTYEDQFDYQTRLNHRVVLDPYPGLPSNVDMDSVRKDGYTTSVDMLLTAVTELYREKFEKTFWNHPDIFHTPGEFADKLQVLKRNLKEYDLLDVRTMLSGSHFYTDNMYFIVTRGEIFRDHWMAHSLIGSRVRRGWKFYLPPQAFKFMCYLYQHCGPARNPLERKRLEGVYNEYIPVRGFCWPTRKEKYLVSGMYRPIDRITDGSELRFYRGGKAKGSTFKRRGVPVAIEESPGTRKPTKREKAMLGPKKDEVIDVVSESDSEED